MYPRIAPRSLTKSEWLGLSTSTKPQGYILALTGSPSISTSSSEPTTAKGSIAYKKQHKSYYKRKAERDKDIHATPYYLIWSPHHPLRRRMGSYKSGCHSEGYLPLSNCRQCYVLSKVFTVMVRTLFLKALSSFGVRASALPITGMTLTRGDSLRINSMSISRKLDQISTEKQRMNITYAWPVGGIK